MQHESGRVVSTLRDLGPSLGKHEAVASHGHLEAAPLAPRTLIPPRDAPHWWPLFDADGRCTKTVEVNCEAWGRLATARLLAPKLAAHYDVPVADVLTALSLLSANLLELIDSPQGWIVLANYVQASTGADPRSPFLPAVQ
jgi:hypothetical protein